jgi:hypothetical protein
LKENPTNMRVIQKACQRSVFACHQSSLVIFVPAISLMSHIHIANRYNMLKPPSSPLKIT